MKYSFPYKLHNREAILSPAVKCARNMVKATMDFMLFNHYYNVQCLAWVTLVLMNLVAIIQACEGHRLPFQ